MAAVRKPFAGGISLLLTLVITLALASLASATTYTWNVSSGNWSTPSNWTPNTGTGGPLPSDSVVFTNYGASTDPNTVNNTVDAGFQGTIANLTNNSVNVDPSNFVYQVTQIPSGQMLNVTNLMVVGWLNEPGPSGAFQTYSIMTGGGTLRVTAPNLAVANYGNELGANTYANLDLSGLNNFIYDNPNGIIGIADVGPAPFVSGTTWVRAGGNVVLAGVSNFINVATINMGTCNAYQGGPLSTLTLGAGTNIIHVGTFNIANNKNRVDVTFAGASGGLQIRGVNGGTNRADILIGNRNVGNGTGTTPGQMLLDGHPVDIMAGSLVVGEVSTTSGPSSSGNGGEFGVGNLEFDTGVVDAQNLVMGYNPAPNANGGLAGVTSTLTVGANATLIVGSGGLSLLDQTASNVCSSTLTISGGSVACNGNITVVTNEAAGTDGAAETNIIQFAGGGTLTLGAGNYAGTTNSPVGQFILDSNTKLEFVAPPPGNQPAIAVDSLVWPADDSTLTLEVDNLPATATVGTTIPLIHFNSMSGGTFTAPAVVLPTGVTGSLSLNGNTIFLTITSTVYPSLLPISPDNKLITLCTNRMLTTTASSLVSTITNVQVVVQSTALGGGSITTVTNSLGAAGLTVTGLGTASADISFALNTNVFYHSITFQVTDANGVSVSLSTGDFDTIMPALVIEASDFNYSQGQFMDTPSDGGLWLYQNQVGVEGIDEHKAPRTSAQIYRTNDAVIIQPADPGAGMPPRATEQKFVTAAANSNTDVVETAVGYNSGGDWLNYTRTFGSGGSAPAGTYDVWCYLATSGSGPQCALYQVTSDPTQTDQTTNLLGYFGSQTFTDDGYNNYVYVPLVDQFGNRVSITLTGQETLRSTIVGNPNIAYYVLTPVVPTVTPVIQNVNPNGPYGATGQFIFTIGPADGATVNTSGIGLILNGAPVTSGLNFNQVGTSWNVSYTIQSNAIYTAVITATNTEGLGATYTANFDTFDPNNYQWEAVDYDFSTNNGTKWIGGQFIDNPVPTCDVSQLQTGHLATDSYFGYPTAFGPGQDPFGLGAVAQQGIDFNWPNLYLTSHPERSTYRLDGIGDQPATDYLRAKFKAAQQQYNDPDIGQINIGYFDTGNWLNYTRHYPTNTFKIWGRLAGGAGSFSGTTLSVVTSGVGTSNQTTQVLGSFSDPNAAGWETYHWIPLRDSNGNDVIVQLGGKETLRLTSGGNVNALCFMLTPAVLSAPSFSISASLVAGQIQISIPTENGHNYTLWHADSLPAIQWTQVGGVIAGDGTIHKINQPLGSQGYYRVSAQ